MYLLQVGTNIQVFVEQTLFLWGFIWFLLFVDFKIYTLCCEKAHTLCEFAFPELQYGKVHNNPVSRCMHPSPDINIWTNKILLKTVKLFFSFFVCLGMVWWRLELGSKQNTRISLPYRHLRHSWAEYISMSMVSCPSH